jgi:acyl carrier protein
MPATVQILGRLPLNHNGKMDRAALPAPSDRPAGTPYTAPENEQEAILCGIFAEVLGVARVGVHDEFGELGGNSLAAAKIVTRIVREFGVQLPVRTVFQQPTVRGLARAVEEAVIAEIRTLGPTATEAAVTSWNES